MPHGGRRRGRPGVAYSNRTDLNSGPRTQPVTAAPSTRYGERVALEDAQRAVPVAPSPVATPPGAGIGGAGAEPAVHRSPRRPHRQPQRTPHRRHRHRPGLGSEALGPPDVPDDLTAWARALYSRFPSEELRSLLEDTDLG